MLKQETKNINYAILFAALTFFIFCKNDNSQKLHKYTLTRYEKVENGYTYSNDLFSYRSNRYRPIVSSAYVNDTLVSAWVFKPEGKIEYSSAGLKADTLLGQMLGIAYKRSVEIRGSRLIDNGKVNQITALVKDSIFSVQKETLFLYTTN